jgi:hypothetical protein
VNAEVMDTNLPQIAQDPDIVNSEIAMHRAAQLARRRAWQAGIRVIVMKDGKIVEESRTGSPAWTSEAGCQGVDDGTVAGLSPLIITNAVNIA